MKLLLVPILALVGLLGATAASVRAEVSPPIRTYTVNVGGGGSGVAANGYFPNLITVHKGDSIHFVNPYPEPHTVTHVAPGVAVPALLIPNPSGPGVVFNPAASNPTNTVASATTVDLGTYYNSGFLFMNGSADVTFNVTNAISAAVGGDLPSPSDFNFICLFHPEMRLGVRVVSTTVDVPSQADIDKLGMAQRDALIGVGKALAADIRPSKSASADGTATWNIQTGRSQGQTDVMQFLPTGPTNITVGDTVKWTSTTDTPHTVSFLGGAPIPPFAQPQGSVLGLNPQVALPAGGPTYDGSGIVNSGLMDDTGQLPGGTTFSLKFTKPGTYNYVCMLHFDQNMTGSIVVAAAVAAPAPPPVPAPISNISAPNTGSGPDADGASSGSLLIAMLLAVTWGAGLFGVARIVRRDGA